LSAVVTPPSSTVRTVGAAVEWPTVMLILGCYGSWLFLTHAYAAWPLWVVAPLVAITLTLHSSVQHEILHGHPTRSVAINRLFGIVPLSLWIPYDRYRKSHLIHHINDRLTDPIDDPESNYWTPEQWAALTRFERAIVQIEETLAGRMIVGPWYRIARFFVHETKALARGDKGVAFVWTVHLALCVPVLYWVKVVCGIPVWEYFCIMVVPGNGILLIRSYAEHRARPAMSERTATVENSWLLGPLFLFNNLHSLHHAEPLLPWYRYNSRYRAVRGRLLAENGGLVYSTYFDVARRFLFRAHDRVLHPAVRVPPRRSPEPVVTRAGAGIADTTWTGRY
jgi:fatty acid desaturase